MSDGDAYRAAVRVWVRADDSDETHNLLTAWCARRWAGRTLPKDSETLSCWVLSIAIQDGFLP